MKNEDLVVMAAGRGFGAQEEEDICENFLS